MALPVMFRYAFPNKRRNASLCPSAFGLQTAKGKGVLEWEVFVVLVASLQVSEQLTERRCRGLESVRG